MRQEIWAVKEYGRPEWNKYVGYTYDCIKKRIDTLKNNNRQYEIKVYQAGDIPKWKH